MTDAALESLKIIVYPDPFLKKPSRVITPEELKTGRAGDWDLRELAERMKVIMLTADGLGLAAPQVGVGLRIFSLNLSKDGSNTLTVFNPVLNEMEGSETAEEGCLSLPGIRAKVKRNARLKLTGVDPEGKPVELQAEGLIARACQHETDHLNGVLFIDRVGIAGRVMIRRPLAELEDDYDRFVLKKKRALSKS